MGTPGVTPPSLVVAVLSVALVLLANWLVAKLGHPPVPAPRGRASVAAIAATAVWIGLMILAGILSVRYIERTSSPVVGYLVYALTVALLSVVRALLYRRVEGQRRTETGQASESTPRSGLLRGMSYLLLAFLLCLLLCAVTGRSFRPVLLIPLLIGTSLPDLDSRTTLVGRLFPPVSRWFEGRFGPCRVWHSLGAAVMVGAVATPLIPLSGWELWAVVPLGFVSHLLREMLEPGGLMVFWPVSRTRYFLPRGFLPQPSGVGGRGLEHGLASVLFLLVLGMLLVVGVGPEPSPPEARASVADLEEIVERYQRIRGRTMVFADVEGVWQASGRRVSARYEVVGAIGKSLVLLDRYTGDFFSGGHLAADQLYLDQVSLLTGVEVRIKPVEVSLREEQLASVWPVVDQMQREPGLQYILISGDVVAAATEQSEPALSPDYSPIRLQKIEEHGGGHYRLRYLTASELVELADVQVISADLVIAATLTIAGAGPTATPLPTPHSWPQPAQPAETAPGAQSEGQRSHGKEP